MKAINELAYNLEKSIRQEIANFQYSHFGHLPKKIFFSYRLWVMVENYLQTAVTLTNSGEIKLYGIPVAVFMSAEYEFYMSEQRNRVTLYGQPTLKKGG